MLARYYDSMPKSFDLFDPFRIFDDAYSSKWRMTSTAPYRVDVIEDVLHLSVDLPGLKSKDLGVQITGREIKVSGKIRDEEFKYSYRLSKDYDPETCDAGLEDGVLTLKFSKIKSAETRTIDVKIK